MAKKKNAEVTADLAVADVGALLATEVPGTLPCCRRCGTDLDGAAREHASQSREGKWTCGACLTHTIEPAANTPLPVAPENTTARPSLAFGAKSRETVKAEGAAKREKDAARKVREVKVDQVRVDAMTEQYELVTRLRRDGVKRADIARESGLDYSRVTFILWHEDYGVGAIPGMPAYSKEAKMAAQARYLADVAARKKEKASA